MIVKESLAGKTDANVQPHHKPTNAVFTARISLTIISHPPSITDRMTGTWIDLISDAFAAAASILLILIVRSTAARQEEKRRRLTLNAVTRKALDLVVATEFSRAASSKN